MRSTPPNRTTTARPRFRAARGLVASGLLALVLASCTYDIEVVTYDPTRAYNGLTLLAPYADNIFRVVDMAGNTTFELELSDTDIDRDFELLEDGTLLMMGKDILFQVRPPDTIVWSLDVPNCHHGLSPMPNGHILFLYHYEIDVAGWDRPFQADGIREVEPTTGAVFWEWKTGDYLSTDEYCPWHIQGLNPDGDYYDWTHSNTVHYVAEESAVYLNVRHLDRILKIAYPSGEILWSLGTGGDFGEGLFSHAHDPEILPNGNIFLFDNGNHRFPIESSRAIEIAYDPVLAWADIVWAWPTEPLFFDSAMGDANRLPNGNALVTSSHHGAIYEVTPDGEIVWNLTFSPFYPSLKPMLYKAERVLSLSWPDAGGGAARPARRTLPQK